MRLSFHGAARDVTGSCHLLECGGLKILVDCGLFQGGREMETHNFEPFGFNPAEIDILLITHAHLDHCGRVPLLVDRGFKGEIITTAASRELIKLVLLDSAHIQEEDAAHAARRAKRRGKHARPALYTVPDVLRSFDLFGRTARYGETIELGGEATVRFEDAGHILGSAILVIEALHGGEKRRLVFSGDLGPSGRSVLRDPTPAPEADYVVMETTYGDRHHRSLPDSIAELYDAITDAFARGGNVIIPTFALERAQELLFHLREGIEEGKLPHYLPVYLDSPMAISATQIFRRHAEGFRPEVGDALRAGDDPFDLPGLHFTRQTAESMALNRVESGAVILAGSGMCTGGRVRHHLKNNIWRRESAIVFVGFAAMGTLAREIIDGAKDVWLFGQKMPVRARIHTINGFSAHAGQGELLDWYRHAGTPRQTFLVHGDPDRGMDEMARLLRKEGYDIHCPALLEQVTLD
jgi:metallo-beta-lactamase family protein